MTILKRILIVFCLLIALLLTAALLLPRLMPGLHSSSLEMIVNVATGRGANTANDVLLGKLKSAPGYQVSIFARDLPHPRMLVRDGEQRLLVSNPRAGTVILLTDSNGDGAANQRTELLQDLRNPHGLALHEGFLYVAESNRIGRVRYDAGVMSGEYTVIVDGLTDDGNHWTKSIAFGPDGKLYLAMGSSCNVCLEADKRRATIMQFDASGSNGRIFASGLRNSVGLAFAPWNGALYATDNGRDLLGDDYPPCELNHIVDGGFYGWPFRNGNNQPDPDFGGQAPSLEAAAISPVHDFPAHNAPLGIHFFPDQQSALVALHGSWNRSQPDGYKVTRLNWQGETIVASDFLWGFERDGDIIGRPVDVIDDGQGGFFISDDYARVIYRVNIQDGFASADNAVQQSLTSQDLNADKVAAGESLFSKMPCGTCHNNPRMALEGLAARYSVESLTAFFLTPTPPMPKFPLSDTERENLAHYLLDSRG